MGTKEIERIKTITRELAEINKSKIIFINGSGHTPWRPDGFKPEDKKDPAKNAYIERIKNDFWSIINNTSIF